MSTPSASSPIFVSHSSSSAGLEALSRCLCMSLLSVISHYCPFPSPLSFLVPKLSARRREHQRKESGRAVGEEGCRVNEEDSSTSSSGFNTNETLRQERRTQNEQMRKARHFRLLSASPPVFPPLSVLIIFPSYILSLFLAFFPYGSRSPFALLDSLSVSFYLFSCSLVFFLVNRPSSF